MAAIPDLLIYSSLMAMNPLTDDYYNKFDQNVDIQNYIDYYIGEIYYQNVDFGDIIGA